MKRITLRNRAVAAVTLYAFTLTTVAPSLAWAAEREEPAPASAAVGATRRVSPSAAGATKFTDAVSAKEVATTPEKVDTAAT